MPLHLIKLAVGIEDVPHLARVQKQRREEAASRGDPPVARHVTRMFPRRAETILDGGSIYWVIRGFIQVRQRIISLDEVAGEDGITRCAILLDEPLVRTMPQPYRAFQGWRYLEPAAAPLDLTTGAGDDEVPPHLALALRELGLI